jgi:hypothetical protein
MNHLEEAKRTAKKLDLRITFSFLEKLGRKRAFRIISQFPTINGIKCEIWKDTRCFKFNCDPLNSGVSPVLYQQDNYGFQDLFNLQSNDELIEIKKGVGSISLKLANRFSSTGEFWEVESNFKEEPTYHRAVILMDKFHKAPVEFIKSGSFETGNSLRVAGFVGLNLNGYSVGIFDYDQEKNNFLFIDCCDKIPPADFQNVIQNITYPYALISGCLVRDEIFILQSSDANFLNITGYQFSKLEDSKRGPGILDPKLMKEFYQSSTTQFFPIENFQKLVETSLVDPRFFRAIKIITESFGYPLEVRAASYSVALETLKNIVVENNQERINPFKSKSDARNLINTLRKEVEKASDSIFNNKEAVFSRIEQLNQVTNSDAFLLAFKIMEIELTDEDKECINMRNDFLHGRIPFENEKGFNEYELHRIVFKLHFLVNALIIKMTGFNGLILNNLKMLDVLKYKKDLNAPLFRKI